MKAYWIGDSDEGVIVFASTRGRARQIGADELHYAFIEVGAARLPELDECAASGVVTCADLERARFSLDDCTSDGHLIVFEASDCHAWVRCPWPDDDAVGDGDATGGG
jgi:hypothetical protein